MDRIEGTEAAIWLAHRAVHYVIVDRDVGEGCQQVPGVGEQSGYGMSDGPGDFDEQQRGTHPFGLGVIVVERRERLRVCLLNHELDHSGGVGIVEAHQLSSSRIAASVSESRSVPSPG